MVAAGSAGPGGWVGGSAASVGAAGSPVRVGLLGLHTNVSVGRCAASRSRAAPGSTEKSRRRSPTTTAGPAVRAMCEGGVGAWKARAGRPRPAVGEQEGLQHLVGAVGAEQPLGRLPEVAAESGAQVACATVGIPVERRGAQL